MMDSSRLFAIPCLQRLALCDVPEWAETHHFLRTTSQLYSYTPTPFFREPSHYMSDLSGTSCVVLKTPAQCGKTLTLMNFLGWMVEFRPATTLLVLDSMKQGVKMSSNRIRPFLRDICGINNPSNARNKNPDKSNSVVNLGLRSGANLFVASAKSASDSRSTPARYVLMDEIDAYPDDVGGEGDPILLFMQRTKRQRGMVVMTSTPTTPDGRVTQNFRLGTAQTWGVVCRDCGQWFPVPYDKIDYSSSTPTISCPHCGMVYSEADVKGLPHAYNSPTNPAPLMDDFGRIRRSYEITAPLCHSFVGWDSLKRQEIAALALGESSYKSFVNTALGEAYTPREDLAVSVPDLMRLSLADYTHDTLPADVAFIVMGVDTHDSCLYAETMGVSEDLHRMYGLRYDVLVGDPNDAGVWEQLWDLFDTAYTRIDSQILRPVMIFQDSGGHRTNAVYVQHYRNRRLMPVKGIVTTMAKAPDPLIGKQTKLKLNGGIKGKCPVQFVGVNAGKDALQLAETLTIAGDRRLFYPRGNGYTLDYFKGLLSEKKVGDRWVAPRGGKTENESLDCRVYALACATYYLQRYYQTGLDKERCMPRKKKVEVDVEKDAQRADNKDSIVTGADSGTVPDGVGGATPATECGTGRSTAPQPRPKPAPSFRHWD